MLGWYWDSKFCCLVKNNFETLFDNLFDSPLHSHTSDTMAENEIVLEEHENQLLRTMHEYLQPSGNSTPSCFIFPLNANNFTFKPGVISLLPNFHDLESESPSLHLKEFEEMCYFQWSNIH